MANTKITYTQKTKFWRPSLSLCKKSEWMDGFWQDGHYYGLATVRISIEKSKRCNSIYLRCTNPKTKMDHNQNYSFINEPTEHELKLICAKFVKDVLSAKTSK